MHTNDAPDARDFLDSIHPGDVDYNKMTRLWFRIQRKLVVQGFLALSKGLRLSVGLLMNLSRYHDDQAKSSNFNQRLFTFATVRIKPAIPCSEAG